MRMRSRIRFVPAALGVVVMLLLAGCSSSGHSSAGDHDHSKRKANSPVAAGAREIAVTGDGNKFSPDTIEVTEGETIAIKLTSNDVDHDLGVDFVGGYVVAIRGQSAVGGFIAPVPGDYPIYCSEPGHQDAGMVGMVKVKAKPRS